MWQALVVLGGIGTLLSTVLAVAYAKLAVHVSEKEEQVLKSLPGANCGACGFSGCEGYAKSLIKGKSEPGLCPIGGNELCEKIGSMLGVNVEEREPNIAMLKCNGNLTHTHKRFNYIGVKNCTASSIIAGGDKSCMYGCIGLGDCIKICKFVAIKISVDKLPVIDDSKCTGCGMCVKVCPKNLLELIPKTQKVYVACSSPDVLKIKRKVCKVSCIGCGICEKNCPYNAIKVENGHAKIDFEHCENCAICVFKCPTHAIIDKLKGRPKAIIGSKCINCGECKEVCLMKAIVEEPEGKYKVILDKCIGCALCYKKCDPKAITMAFSLGYIER